MLKRKQVKMQVRKEINTIVIFVYTNKMCVCVNVYVHI